MRSKEVYDQRVLTEKQAFHNWIVKEVSKLTAM
jgi:hypothetical protein